jgi:mycofactocin precursor
MADSAAKLLDPPAVNAAADQEPAGHVTGRPAGAEPASAPQPEVLAADLLVEEISIDGMCGVY